MRETLEFFKQVFDNRTEITKLRNEVVELKRESARVKEQTSLQEVYSRRDNFTIRGVRFKKSNLLKYVPPVKYIFQ